MAYEIFGRQERLDFGATGVKEVLQNVRTWLCTPVFSVPLDRSLGIDTRIVDRPLNKAKAQISAEILSELPKVEPRVKVLELDFVSDTSDALAGRLVPRLKVEVKL